MVFQTRSSSLSGYIVYFCEMYAAYYELGGNGMIPHMKDEIEKLEIRKER